MALSRRVAPAPKPWARNQAFIRVRIPGAPKLPLASNVIARGASPAVRAIRHCYCLLMLPRLGPVRRRLADRRQLRLRLREPNRISHCKPENSRRQSRRQSSPSLARPCNAAHWRFARIDPRNRPRSNPPRSSPFRVPLQFRIFSPANWPIASSIVRASWKSRRFCRRRPHWAEC